MSLQVLGQFQRELSKDKKMTQKLRQYKCSMCCGLPINCRSMTPDQGIQIPHPRLKSKSITIAFKSTLLQRLPTSENISTFLSTFSGSSHLVGNWITRDFDLNAFLYIANKMVF